MKKIYNTLKVFATILLILFIVAKVGLPLLKMTTNLSGDEYDLFSEIVNLVFSTFCQIILLIWIIVSFKPTIKYYEQEEIDITLDAEKEMIKS